MKIYTKTGDRGETGLLGGKRVSKSHACIQAIGAVDELNSWMGVIRSHLGESEAELSNRFAAIQDDLFRLGSTLAGCLGGSEKNVHVADSRAESLEGWMDELTEQLAPLTCFILPGGCVLASWLHLARAVCRRAERRLIELVGSACEQLTDDLGREVIYLNRLGDLLFLLGRQANAWAAHPETEWHA